MSNDQHADSRVPSALVTGAPRGIGPTLLMAVLTNLPIAFRDRLLRSGSGQP